MKTVAIQFEVLRTRLVRKMNKVPAMLLKWPAEDGVRFVKLNPAATPVNIREAGMVPSKVSRSRKGNWMVVFVQQPRAAT